MKLFPSKITVQVQDAEGFKGEITISEDGIDFKGRKPYPTNDELYSFIVHWFDHFRAPREVLVLKAGKSLHERVCPKLSDVPETVTLEKR